jgi:hypothetical protein
MQGDTFNPTGHLEVWKVYRDGTKELHWTDHNVITSGMGIGLAQLYSASGSDSILDYQILNFQVGTSGDTTNYGVSSYKLQGPLSGVRPYGIQTGLQAQGF